MPNDTQTPDEDSIQDKEIVWPSNIGGYGVYLISEHEDGHQGGDLSIAESDLPNLAELLGLNPDETLEVLTTRAGDLTLKQLILTLDYLKTQWAEAGNSPVTCFTAEISHIENEFLSSHGPPQ